jgi:SAM-dependent methyltransferase
MKSTIHQQIRGVIYKIYRLLFPIAYQLFAIMMAKSARFRSFIAQPRDPRNSVYAKIFYKLHWEWWQRRPYSSELYKVWQKGYWSTVGASRWIEVDDYDYVDTKQLLMRTLLASDCSLLELGCGRGVNLEFINQTFPHLKICAIDASDVMCKVARNRVPNAQVFCGFYGPEAPVLPFSSFDLVFARSTLTYVDETDIESVLRWVFEKAVRCVVISEPSGELDQTLIQTSGLRIVEIKPGVYKRLHDHTHIRDYSEYVIRLQLPFAMKESTLERNKGNRMYVFARVN